MEKTKIKIKAIELCYSAAGEIRLGFFFIQDYLIFLKTFYDNTLCLPENLTQQIELRIYRGRLGKCIFKRTKNNRRTVKELAQTTAGINGYDGVFTITILYGVSDIEKLRKILNETIYSNSMKIYYVGYSSRSVLVGSSFKTVESYLLIKEEIRYNEVY